MIYGYVCVYIYIYVYQQVVTVPRSYRAMSIDVLLQQSIWGFQLASMGAFNNQSPHIDPIDIRGLIMRTPTKWTGNV